MTYRTEIGKLGEDKACEYLVDKKFKIIERNFRRKWGELDIVVLAPDKTLVFVEVETLQNALCGPAKGLRPEDQMTASKIKKFKRTASLYAGGHPELIDDNRGWRLDLVAITIDGIQPLTKTRKSFVVRHYQNIV